ncbi:unnamed protein product [Durusdinium trenchii]|eukprot:g16310.t1
MNGRLRILCLEVAGLTLRCALTLVLTCLAAACGCAIMADTNTLLYGLEVHKSYSDLIARVPSQVLSLAILVVPSCCCWCCLQGPRSPAPNPGSRWKSWRSSCTAALVAGFVLGVLAGPAPGPYMAHVRDADLREETNGTYVQTRATRPEQSSDL